MTINEISQRWGVIAWNPSTEYTYVKIHPECILNLCIGFSEGGMRNLVLELDSQTLRYAIHRELENIAFVVDKENSNIRILLKDSRFNSLFDYFCHAVYSEIKDVREPGKGYLAIQKVFGQWAGFFRPVNSGLLTFESIKGLWGELFFIFHLLQNNSTATVDEVLTAWSGPDGDSHDFCFTERDFEIKTIEQTKERVKISSEHQLYSQQGRGLTLVLIRVAEGLGMSISELIQIVIQLILNAFGSLHLFLDKIARAGLPMEQFASYDSWKFQAKSIAEYDSQSDEFPKLTPKTLGDGISHASYSISINRLHSFLTNVHEYNDEHR